MSLRSFIVPRKIAVSGSRFNKKIEVSESFGSKQLLVNGIVQTGRYTNALFAAGLKKLHGWHQGNMDRILVLGVGGGGVFAQLHRVYPHAEITGVDIDGEIIRLAKEYFRVDSVPGVRLIESDARNFVRKTDAGNSRYDLVIIDIYNGNDVPSFVSGSDFLKTVGSWVRDGGTVMMNYFSFSRQAEKSRVLTGVLRTIFPDVTAQKNRKNIFFYCRK